MNFKHGESDTPLHRCWSAMKNRCNNPRNDDYHEYGGRGIRVYPAWNDYTVFASWARSNGYAAGLSIDRVDTDGNYIPKNCRWTNALTQVLNRRKQRNNTSGFIGVSQHKQTLKWHASIKANGRSKFIGSFDDPIEAAVARDRVAIELWGGKAKLNFPEEYQDVRL